MANYSVVHLDEVKDILGDYPGDMKMMKDPLKTEQVAVTYRRMPQHTGGKGSYGHRHHTQDEIIFVISGTIQVKVEADVFELCPKSVIRVAAGSTQSTWNEQPEDAEILIISNRSPKDDKVDKINDFWPLDSDKISNPDPDNDKYTILKLEDITDMSGDYPGEVKMLKKSLGGTQMALTYRRLPSDTGSIRGSRRGHRHKHQEEVIFVLSGTLTVKLEDELVKVASNAAIRIAPGVAQDMWNYGPNEVELLIISTYIENLMDDLEIIPDFWPEEIKSV